MALAITGDLAATVELLAEALDVDLAAGPDEDERSKRVRRSWEAACSSLDFQLKDAFRPVEAHVLDGMRLEVAMEEFKRLDAPGGGSQYVNPEGGQQVRGPRDPLNRVYPILDRYRVPM